MSARNHGDRDERRSPGDEPAAEPPPRARPAADGRASAFAPDHLPGMEPTPARMEAELREEMEAHMAHRVDDLVAEGVDPGEARRRAEEEFGSPGRYGREVRRQEVRARGRRRWRGLWDGLRQDVTFALRQLRRAPGFTLAALVTLTLGIGAATATVGVVRAVVLDPLPLQDPDELVYLEMLTPEGSDFSVSEPAFLEWQARLQGMDGVMAFAVRGATLRDPGDPRVVNRGTLSAGGLSVLGLSPLVGREFTAQEDGPGQPAAVAMVSESLWRSAFAADPGVVGSSLELDAVRYEIVGVVPGAMEEVFGDLPVITPLGADPAMDRGEHYLDVVARLGPGVTADDAGVELRDVAAFQSRSYIEDRDWSAKLTPLKEVVVGPSVLQAGWVLMAGAGLLLLMACGNVSNLLLARATTRSTELRVRRALGAGRGRVTRQLLTESAVLAAVGGAGGAVLCTVLVPWIRRLGMGRIPRIENAVVEPQVLLLALAAAGLATLLFGWVPGLAVRSASGSAGSAGSSRGATDGSRRLRRGLVVGQIAASVVLLVGTGLLLRSFASLSRVEIGFDATDRYVYGLSMPDDAYPWHERADLLAGIEAAIRAHPGVEAVGATAIEPFVGYALVNNVARADRMPDRSSEFPPVMWRPVTPDYFVAAGVETLAGRTFVDADYSEEMQEVPVVIDRELATTLFEVPGDAVGSTLVWGNRNGSLMRVTGVVESVRDVRLTDAQPSMIYRLHRNIPWAQMTLVVRSGAPPAEVTRAVRQGVAEAAPGMPLPTGRTLSDAVDRALVGPRFNALVLGAFGLVGLALALVGIYGVTAYEVRQRFREIGIRISLGARPEGIRALILGDGLRLAAWGLALGAVAAFLATRLLETLLFEVRPADPLTWGVTLAVLGVGVLAAQLVPARQATRVDPVEVLSGE